MVPGEPFPTLLNVQQLEQAGFFSDEAVRLLMLKVRSLQRAYHADAPPLALLLVIIHQQQGNDMRLSRQEGGCMKSTKNLEQAPSERARVTLPEE